MSLLIAHAGQVELAVVLFSQLLIGLIILPLVALFLLDLSVYSSRLVANYTLNLVYFKLQDVSEARDVAEGQDLADSSQYGVVYYNDVSSGQWKAVVTSYNRSLRGLTFKARGFWRSVLRVAIGHRGVFRAMLPFKGQLKLPLVFLRYEMVKKDD